MYFTSRHGAHVIIHWRWVVPGMDSSICLANEVRVNEKRGYEIEIVPR